MSFFRYPGGKYKLRKPICNLLNNKEKIFIEYREPFFGGGGIGIRFLEHNLHIKNIWINDKDIGLSCLWTIVIKYPQLLINKINNYTPIIEDFYSFKKDLLSISIIPSSDDDIIDIGFKKLVLHQISYSGLGTKSGGPLGGAKQLSNYKIDCRWSPTYINKKIIRISNLLNRFIIYENSCTNYDFSKVISMNDTGVIMYIDPPYYIKGNQLYQHGFTHDDHERLCELLKLSQSSWILSYDDCNKIRQLYKSYNILDVDVNYTIVSNKAKQKEILILS